MIVFVSTDNLIPVVLPIRPVADPWQGPVSEQGESYVRAGIGNGRSEPITIQLLLLSAAESDIVRLQFR